MTFPIISKAGKESIRLFETFPIKSRQHPEKLKYLVNMLSFSALQDIDVAFCYHNDHWPYQYQLKQKIALFPNTRYWVGATNNCIAPLLRMKVKNLRQFHILGNDLVLPTREQLKNRMWRVSLIGAFHQECPFALLADTCRKFQALGVKVVIYDKGNATPDKVRETLKDLFKTEISPDLLAMNFEGERNYTIRNISVAYVQGVKEFETSIAGSIPTQEIARAFEKMGCSSGINLERLERIAAIAKKDYM